MDFQGNRFPRAPATASKTNSRRSLVVCEPERSTSPTTGRLRIHLSASDNCSPSSAAKRVPSGSGSTSCSLRVSDSNGLRPLSVEASANAKSILATTFRTVNLRAQAGGSLVVGQEAEDALRMLAVQNPTWDAGTVGRSSCCHLRVRPSSISDT